MPYISVNVSMRDFSDDELVREMQSRGYECSDGSYSESLSKADLARIEHLSGCGQLEAARDETLFMVGRAIGRDLLRR